MNHTWVNFNFMNFLVFPKLTKTFGSSISKWSSDTNSLTNRLPLLPPFGIKILVVFCVNQICAQKLTQGFSNDFAWWFPQVRWVTFKTTSYKLLGNCSKKIWHKLLGCLGHTSETRSRNKGGAWTWEWSLANSLVWSIHSKQHVVRWRHWKSIRQDWFMIRIYTLVAKQTNS